MTTRDIENTVKRLYEIDISPTLIGEVTEAVQGEAKAWQPRTLDTLLGGSGASGSSCSPTLHMIMPFIICKVGA